MDNTNKAALCSVCKQGHATVGKLCDDCMKEANALILKHRISGTVDIENAAIVFVLKVDAEINAIRQNLNRLISTNIISLEDMKEMVLEFSNTIEGASSALQLDSLQVSLQNEISEAMIRFKKMLNMYI